MPPKKKRLSNKPEKKQSKVSPQLTRKLTDNIDTSKALHVTAMPLSKIIDLPTNRKKQKEVKK